VAAHAVAVEVNEGQIAVNTGSYSDPGADAVTLTASIGAVVADLEGTWNWSYETSDGPDESRTVIISAEDDDGDTTLTTFELKVNEVAPTFDISGASSVTAGQDYTLNYSAFDPGADPIVSWVIDWGDGTVQTVDGSLTSLTYNYITPRFLAGDFDGDGVVSRRDRSVFRANFGRTGENLAGDFDGDGVVSVLDRATFRANFGKSGYGAYRISVTAIDEDDNAYILDPLEVTVVL